MIFRLLFQQILWAKSGYVNTGHCYSTGASVHIFLVRRPVTEHLNASQQRFVNFFLEKYNRCVSYTDRMEFINGWYVLVIISDVMTIIGSILKMEIKAKVRGALGKVLNSLESSVMCFNLDKWKWAAAVTCHLVYFLLALISISIIDSCTGRYLGLCVFITWHLLCM